MWFQRFLESGTAVADPTPAVEEALPLADLAPPTEAGARDVRRRLIASGASPALVSRIVTAVVASGKRGAFAFDVAARAIEEDFRPSASPRRDGTTRVIAFVGPTGAGGTTSLAKLGRRMARSGRSVVFASLDPAGAATLTGIAWGFDERRHPEIPCVAIRTAAEIDELIDTWHGVDAILLDLPGVSPANTERLAHLERILGAVGKRVALDTYLVLPATTSARALGRAANAFCAFDPRGAVITKLDETSEPTAALEQCQSNGLPVTFFSNGQDLENDFLRPNPRHFSDLMLRGRIA